MLRKSQSVPQRPEVDDEHTMIGNSQELAAKSMSVVDERAVAMRPSSNVVRRTGPVVVQPVAPEAEVQTALVDEDDAFAPWEDAQQRTAPDSPPEVVAALKEPAAQPLPFIQPVSPPPPHAPPPWIAAPMPMAISMPVSRPVAVAQPRADVIAPARRSRTIVILSILVIALLVGVVVGYRRIVSLENELAATKAALDTANARTR